MKARLLMAAAFVVAIPTLTMAADVKEVRPTGRPISIEAGHGTALQTTDHVATVFVANGEVADVHLAANQSDLVYVYGKKPGTTALYGVDENGRIVVNATIIVAQRDIKVMRGGTVTVWKRGDLTSGGSGTDVSQLPAGSQVTVPVGGK